MKAAVVPLSIGLVLTILASPSFSKPIPRPLRRDSATASCPGTLLGPSGNAYFGISVDSECSSRAWPLCQALTNVPKSDVSAQDTRTLSKLAIPFEETPTPTRTLPTEPEAVSKDKKSSLAEVLPADKVGPSPPHVTYKDDTLMVEESLLGEGGACPRPPKVTHSDSIGDGLGPDHTDSAPPTVTYKDDFCASGLVSEEEENLAEPQATSPVVLGDDATDPPDPKVTSPVTLDDSADPPSPKVTSPVVIDDAGPPGPQATAPVVLDVMAFELKANIRDVFEEDQEACSMGLAISEQDPLMYEYEIGHIEDTVTCPRRG
ncbi:hypothetical protein BGW38_002837 [Lunasporangiospora selenospora]|uniref:Uncharacterized protein n=1 Tax=Lunasporangiospora selenospora TaxID=979761 RepID=A0A9P6FSP7_9FUNG|nr:hypothetical protein BGW38_002837 [Lunasporangiospora selenospora]